MLDDKGIVIKGLMDKKRKSSIDLSFIITYSYKVRVSSPNERKGITDAGVESALKCSLTCC
jgi:hypothetical protein